jgi:hypothetical protein
VSDPIGQADGQVARPRVQKSDCRNHNGNPNAADRSAIDPMVSDRSASHLAMIRWCPTEATTSIDIRFKTRPNSREPIGIYAHGPRCRTTPQKTVAGQIERDRLCEPNSARRRQSEIRQGTTAAMGRSPATRFPSRSRLQRVRDCAVSAMRSSAPAVCGPERRAIVWPGDPGALIRRLAHAPAPYLFNGTSSSGPHGCRLSANDDGCRCRRIVRVFPPLAQ